MDNQSIGKQWYYRGYFRNITLTMEDVEISSQDIEGWLVANSNGITVALDIVISQIEKRRNCEELVNRIQNIRKDSDLK
jgi:isoleucyl-tRNA synthetase